MRYTVDVAVFCKATLDKYILHLADEIGTNGLLPLSPFSLLILLGQKKVWKQTQASWVLRTTPYKYHPVKSVAFSPWTTKHTKNFRGDKQVSDSWKSPHRWETILLLKVWQEIHHLKQFKDSWKNPHWWKTIQLFKVWKEVQSSSAFEDSWKNPHWR